jgi:DNA-binding NarL/FixJ family response regulator
VGVASLNNTMTQESAAKKTELPQPSNIMKVVVIEDLREVREGLTALINGTVGYKCIGSYYSIETALARMGEERPDVILTDIGLPGMSGIEGIPILHTQFPGVPILALTVYDNDRQIFDALCAGAMGYLLKNTPPVRLLDSIKEAADGGSPMSPEVARRVVKLFREFRPPESASYHLTPQETELLKLLIKGHRPRHARWVFPPRQLSFISKHLPKAASSLKD